MLKHEHKFAHFKFDASNTLKKSWGRGMFITVN